MKAFFDRHAKNKSASGGKPLAEDKGYIAWCLKGDSMILLEDGSHKTISEIVDNQLDVKVISYNEKENKFEPKRITGWSKANSSINDFYVLGKDKTDRRGVSNKTFLAATAEHPFYVNGEWVEAQNMQDKELSLVDFGLDEVSEQILYGTLLGDGCVCKSAKNSATLRISHSIKQREYLIEKARLLSELGNKFYTGIAKSGYGEGKEHITSFSKTSMYLNNIRNQFYIDGKKRVSKEILEKLGDIGFAFWIMDDGKLKQSQKNGEEAWVLHTEGFDPESIEIIKYYLNKKYDINVRSHYRENTDGQYLYIVKKDTDKLMSILAKYFHPSMRYKLFSKYREVPYELENYTPSKRLVIINQMPSRFGKALEVYNCKASKKPYKWKYRYNLEIEDNHNYVANGVLVHNCLWGGDPGQSWANKVVRQMDAADKKK
jgi:intein/homing endonuclease